MEFDFGEGIISGSSLLGFLTIIENAVDSIKIIAGQNDSTDYLVSIVDLVWDVEQTSGYVDVNVIVVLNGGGYIPLIDVPCDLLSLSTWSYNGVNNVGLDYFILDSRTSGFPVPFAHIGANVYMRSYLALTYLLNKAVCNPNLAVLATPANDPNGYWVFNIDFAEWEYICGSGTNSHWNHSSKLWSHVVNPPWGAPLQSRAHVIDEYDYILTLANDNKPYNKHVVHYAVFEGLPCRGTSGPQYPIVRRSHKLTVTYGNWFYVSTVGQ
ncbi:MAG: hypothetical protein ACK417_07010 [Bacteroidia bacterium]